MKVFTVECPDCGTQTTITPENFVRGFICRMCFRSVAGIDIMPAPASRTRAEVKKGEDSQEKQRRLFETMTELCLSTNYLVEKKTRKGEMERVYDDQLVEGFHDFLAKEAHSIISRVLQELSPEEREAHKTRWAKRIEAWGKQC